VISSVGWVEFQDVVRRRRMVRSFTSEPVASTSLDRILHNATRGPSAGFSQGQAFLVLEGAELEAFWTVGAAWVHESARTAQVVIVPLSSKRVYLDRYAEDDKGWTDRDEKRWPVPYWHIDTGMAALLILQTAVDEGLGAVYFGFDPERVTEFRELFGVPEDHEPIGAIAIGHSAEPGPTNTAAITRRRKSLDDVVHRGRW
jgi:nitroreductase